MTYQEPAHILVFRRWYMRLIHHMNVKEVVGWLFQSECLSHRAHEHIKAVCSEKGQTEAADILMTEIVLRNPDPLCFEHFADALDKTNNKILAKQLRRDFQAFQDLSDDQDEARPPLQYSVQEEHTEERSVASPQPQTADLQDVQTSIVTPAGNSAANTSAAISTPAGNSPAANEFPPDPRYKPGADQPEYFVNEFNLSKIILDRKNTIGKGRFGTVYKAEYLHSTVAVKEITLPIAKQRGITLAQIKEKHITREFQVNVYIRHAHVTLLMAYALEKNAVYLMFEYIDGDNLQNIMFDEEVYNKYNLTKSDKLRLTGQISQALAFLHACSPRVIHGDIKPANMLVTSNKATAKLCDLGLSKLKAENASTTMDGNSQPGTPDYMAPELLNNSKSSNTRSDVWSMGASLYEIFFEEAVWKQDDINEMRKMFDENNSCKPRLVQNPEQSTINVGEKVVQLIEECMRYESDKRPDALQLMRDLHAVETI